MDNQNLPFPLYHGTSSIFLEGILDLGLGGNNPIENLNIYKFAKDLEHHIDKHLGKNEIHDSKFYGLKLMANQERSFYQHGSTYLSTIISKASGYAMNNLYGSELLSSCITCYQALSNDYSIDFGRKFYKEHNNLLNLTIQRPSPILIKATDISVTSLTYEDGRDIDKNEFNNLLEMHSEDYIPEKNFRLATPAYDLSFFLITDQNADGFSIAPLNPKALIKLPLFN